MLMLLLELLLIFKGVSIFLCLDSRFFGWRDVQVHWTGHGWRGNMFDGVQDCSHFQRGFYRVELISLPRMILSDKPDIVVATPARALVILQSKVCVNSTSSP